MSGLTEHDLALAITIARAREVFHDMTLCRQELSIRESLIGKAIARNDPNPVPRIEIEGIRELFGYLWHPAFNAINGD